MTNNQNHNLPAPGSSQAKPGSEEMVKQLEQFPIEVLEAALLVLQMRQTKPKQ